jgi:hypothetical protein
MTTDESNIPAWPHKPAPPEPKRLLPEWPMLWRGLALGAAAFSLLGLERRLFRSKHHSARLATPAAAIAAMLFAWAAAIHLTGGERFDDHKWV